jgi:flagellar basal body rod protein FlgG
MSTFTQLFNIPQSGMRLNMLDLYTISNNLANINTSGYKASRLNFQELLQKTTLEGSTLAGQQINTNQGALETTERSMDWAISGDGYFAVRLQNGEVAYTRDGSFEVDANRNIVTSDGLPLIWSGTLPEGAQSVQIDSSGNVTYATSSTDQNRLSAGQVTLYRFINPSGLINTGGNLWSASDTSGTAISGTPNTNGLGSTVGSTLESSNVELSDQFSHMLVVERAFQMTSRALTQADTMMSEAIQMRSA